MQRLVAVRADFEADLLDAGCAEMAHGAIVFCRRKLFTVDVNQMQVLVEPTRAIAAVVVTHDATFYTVDAKFFYSCHRWDEQAHFPRGIRHVTIGAAELFEMGCFFLADLNGPVQSSDQCLAGIVPPGSCANLEGSELFLRQIFGYVQLHDHVGSGWIERRIFERLIGGLGCRAKAEGRRPDMIGIARTKLT